MPWFIVVECHGLEVLDDDTLVVNPEHRTVRKAIAKHQARLNSLHARIARVRKEGKAVDALATEVAVIEEALTELKERRGSLANHVRVGDLPADEKPDTLPRARRLFIDLIRMMMPVIEGKARPNTVRTLLAALMTADANILPDHDKGIIRVEILGLASNATEQSLLPLIEQLNHTRTVHPGTNVTMIYSIDKASPRNRLI